MTANHLIDECYDNENHTKYMQFVLVDSSNNTDNSNTEKVHKLLITKETFSIGSLVTQHKGLNNPAQRVKRNT